MKPIVLSLAIVFTITSAFAQDFSVPKNYVLEKAEDYKKYQQDFLDCFEWIMKTPVNTEKEKRKKANAFMLKWLSGSPDVSIELQPDMVTFMGESPEYLMIFIGAWAKYSIENEKYDDVVGGNYAGIVAVIDFYNANRKYVSKSKKIEK